MVAAHIATALAEPKMVILHHLTLIAGRRAKGHKSKYDAVVGHTVDVPAPIFGVDIPDLYYRGTVLKKDPAHAGTHSQSYSRVQQGFFAFS